MTEKPIVSVRNFAADRAICEAATEGPWTADGSYVEIPDDFYVGERGPLAYGASRAVTKMPRSLPKPAPDGLPLWTGLRSWRQLYTE